MLNDSQNKRDATFAHRLLMTLLIIILTVAFLCTLYYAIDIFLLMFAGVLFAVFLSSMAQWMTQHTRLSKKMALTTVLVLLILLTVIIIKMVIPPIAQQFAELQQILPATLQRTYDNLSEYEWSRWIMKNFDPSLLFPSNEVLLGRTAPVATKMLGGILSFFLIIAIGIYLAFDWKTYQGGFIKLFPIDKRERVEDVINTITDKLRLWLMGKFLAMVIIGVSTGIGLKLLGIKLAAILGLMAGILAFIPNFGPILSAIPAILIGFVQSPQLAVWVAVLYAGTQMVETWFITPLIERQTVQFPPVLVIFVQIVAGILLGFWGLLLASPLLIVIMVLVQKFYIEDVLRDTV